MNMVYIVKLLDHVTDMEEILEIVAANNNQERRLARMRVDTLAVEARNKKGPRSQFRLDYKLYDYLPRILLIHAPTGELEQELIMELMPVKNYIQSMEDGKLVLKEG